MAFPLMDLLFHPAVMAAVLVCYGLVAVLLVKKHRLSRGARLILGTVGVVCLLYAAFVVWVSIGFGEPVPPIADPVMPE